MGFSRQKYWSGLPFPLQGIFPTQGSNLCLLHCRQLLHHCTTWEYRPQIVLADSGCSKNCKNKFSSYKPNLCFLKVKVKIAQLCPVLCDPRDYTVHGILQARILEWVAYSFSRGSSHPGIKSSAPTLQADSSPAEPQGKPMNTEVGSLSLLVDLPDPGIEPGSPALQAYSLLAELPGKPW